MKKIENKDHSGGASSESASPEATEVSEEAQDSRRKLLQSLAAGGVIGSANLVPDKWAKPAVDTLILPAHARPSVVMVMAASGAGAGTDLNDGQEEQSLAGRAMNFVVEPAAAGSGGISKMDCQKLRRECITFTISHGAGGHLIDAVVSNSPWSGSGTLDGLNIQAPGIPVGPFILTGGFDDHTYQTGSGNTGGPPPCEVWDTSLGCTIPPPPTGTRPPPTGTRPPPTGTKPPLTGTKPPLP